MNKTVLLLASGLLFGACHRAVPTKSSAAGPGTSVPIATPKDAVAKATNLDVSYLVAKGKAQVTLKGDKKSANVNLRMRRDSAIWLSAGLLGFEGVRALLTPDSVRVTNRLDHTYFAGGYDYLTKVLNVPVSFAQVQALLLGNYLPAPAGTKATATTTADGSRQVQYPLQSVLVEYLLQAANGRVQQLGMTEGTRNLVVKYADYQKVDGSDVPLANDLDVQAKQGAEATSFSLHFTNARANERVDFPYDVPKGFKRITGK